MGIAICDHLLLAGRFHLQLVDDDGRVCTSSNYTNTVTYSGLSAVASALAYAGVANIASTIGYTTVVDLTPLYGAVGTGDVTATAPTPSDTGLLVELERAVVTMAVSTPAASDVSAQSQWSFYFTANSTTYSLTEAGIFANATSSSGAGTLMNHAAFDSAFTWTSGYNLQMQVSISQGLT